MERLKASGARVALDASGRALSESAKSAEFLKPNEEELNLLAPGLCPVDGAKRLVEEGAGAEAVLVTLGADGAVLATPEGAWRAPPPPPPLAAVNTVGAGDAALSGLLWGLAEGAPAPELLRRAVSCASSAVLQSGAGELDRGEVERFMTAVRPERA